MFAPPDTARNETNPFIAAVIAANGKPVDVEVWPENWPAFTIFVRIRTQWAVGFAGPTGLRYESLYPLLDREAADPEAWQQLFDDVRELESGALDAFAEQRKKNE